MDAKLKKVRAYKNTSGMWFLKLVYEYTDNAGNLRHRIYPKLLLPLAQLGLPEEHFDDVRYTTGETIRPYLKCDSRAMLYQCTCDEAIKRNVSDSSYAFDIIIEEAQPKKMTMKEIEERLGCKIEIVSEENNDA